MTAFGEPSLGGFNQVKYFTWLTSGAGIAYVEIGAKTNMSRLRSVGSEVSNLQSSSFDLF